MRRVGSTTTCTGSGNRPCTCSCDWLAGASPKADGYSDVGHVTGGRKGRPRPGKNLPKYQRGFLILEPLYNSCGIRQTGGTLLW